MPRAAKPLSSERQRLIEMLRSSLWARELTPEQLQRIEADVVELHFAIGAYVCRKGDSVDSWPGVVSGLVKLGSVSVAGKSVSFQGVAAGGWFGEGSLLKSEPRKYDAIALRDTCIASMPRGTFNWLRMNSIPFNQFLLNQLNERLAYFIGLVENDRSRSPDARVAQGLAALFNPQLSPGTERSLQISQEEIGHLSGLSRQRVNHALHVLEKRSLLRVEHVGITVTDLAGLRNFVD
jgi:CRP/FNR family transcriptional regulator, cyclic AMP receptor protein